MRPPDEVVGLHDLGDQAALSAEWLRLLDRLGVSDYCTTPDWALSWWATIGRREATRIAVWRDELGAEAIVPLCRHREQLHHRVPVPMSAWVNLGGGRGNADHLRVLSIDARRADVDAWLRRSTRLRPLHLRSIDPAAPVPAGRHVVTERTRCPRLTLDGPGDPVPADYRKRLTYYRRRLGREGVEFTVQEPGTPLGSTLGELLDLHEARWETASGVRPTHLRDRTAFFHELARRADADRGPVLVTARRDGRTVGVLLGFWFGTTFSYFQNGWDPGVAVHNVGSVLIDEAIAWAQGRGARTFDFMRGPAAFKYRFGAVDHDDRSVLYPGGPEGVLFRAKYTAGRGLARGLARRGR